MARGERVLVTGAAGTVGHYVVALAEAAGYEVIATDRARTALTSPVRGAIRAGDLTDDAFVERVVEGCELVIHTAAHLDVAADAGTLAKVNTDVVVRLYEAARRAGAKRFVHTSTAMLYAPGGREPRSEASPLEPRGAYGLSKFGAEAFLRAHGEGAGPAWTIVRPAPLYGRRGRHFAAGLLVVGPMLRIASPLVPRPRGGPVHSLIHAEDVARALVHVLADPGARFETFNVADADPMALGDRLADTFDAYSLRSFRAGVLHPRLLSWVESAAGAPGASHAFDAWALGVWKAVVLRHRLKPALRPALDREAVTLLSGDLVIDSSKLRATGWRPRFDRFSTGWRDVLKWYQAERWVPRYA